MQDPVPIQELLEEPPLDQRSKLKETLPPHRSTSKSYRTKKTQVEETQLRFLSTLMSVPKKPQFQLKTRSRQRGSLASVKRSRKEKSNQGENGVRRQGPRSQRIPSGTNCMRRAISPTNRTCDEQLEWLLAMHITRDAPMYRMVQCSIHGR